MISDAAYNQLVAAHGLVGASIKMAQADRLNSYRNPPPKQTGKTRVAQHYKGEYNHTIGKSADPKAIEQLKSRGRNDGDWTVVLS